MLKQVSEVCAGIHTYTALSCKVSTAEPLPIGMVQEREIPPYMGATDTPVFQNQNITWGSCKKLT